MFEDFVGMYKLSKTLRFELKPVGKTLENIKKSGVLDRDFARADEYQAVKDIIDAQHKALLERAFSNFADADWQELADAYAKFRKGDKSKASRDELEVKNAKFRQLIVKSLKSDDMYSALTGATPKDLFKLMLKQAEERHEDPNKAVAMFSTFACYFTGFQENRRNIYSPENKVTSAANRAVNENFPRFLECCAIFGHVSKKHPSIIADTEKELSSLLVGCKLQDVFCIPNYGKVLSQSGINYINNIIGGWAPKQGEKRRGLNEFINLYRQKHEEVRSDKCLAKMPLLYKQILSDRETISFVTEDFETDRNVLDVIGQFGDGLVKRKTLERIESCLAYVNADPGIFIGSEKLPDVSMVICGEWSQLGRGLENVAEAKFSCITAKTKRESEKLKWLRRAEYPLSDFVGFTVPDDSESGWKTIDIAECWKGPVAQERFAAVREAYGKLKGVLSNKEEMGLRERSEDVAAIKCYLDSVMSLLHLLKPLHVGADLERNMDFYGEFDPLYDELDSVVPLYNRVRNYITCKPSEAKKMKLMFDSPTLADGWDQNKEKDNKSVLFVRNGTYYLGILNPGSAREVDFEAMRKKSNGTGYQKMVYKLLPGPNKMLPKVFFSKKGMSTFNPPEDLLERYHAGDYKKGPNFDIRFCRRLIDFFKKSIAMHDDWSKFDFKFSSTESYNGIDEFYREVSDQGYKISFVNIAAEEIDDLVESGKMFLFSLSNKDFSAGSNGRKNLHTLYWEGLFVPANIQDVVLKLNGEAELFYRRASITKPYVHKKGEKLVNRRDKDGNSIPDDVFGDLFDYANGRKDKSALGVVAAKLLAAGKVTIKDVTHTITKDARFAEDKFFFHVPITINARADERPKQFNDRVNRAVRNRSDVNVIGIDRGERNLLYVTVVDQCGKILEQRSFNALGRQTYGGEVVMVDYHAKLDQVEKSRDAARKSWSEIGKIKDLKAGYLSVVVHEITELMVKYNAVVVLEDLNFGFKRGRFAIEKQVYQKFEKALIDKLNYLVFKDRDANVDGGLLRGYQLTDKFASFKDLGKQTGFVYYVPAAYTSKIDPTTGFTNIFDLKKCTNAENIKEFFDRFTSIRYDPSSDAFAFAFDYENFPTRFSSWKSDWIVYSAKRRIVYDRNAKTSRVVNPTDEIKSVLKMAGVAISDGFDLLSYVRGLDPSRENANIFKTIFFAFERTLQMRYSNAATGEDYIESPVKNASGKFFDTRKSDGTLPQDADANGAYHIALKGLWILQEALSSDKPKIKLEHDEWLKFVQTRSH